MQKTSINLSPYVIKDTDLFMSSTPEGAPGSARVYDLRLRDLPVEEKPREKLMAYGPAPLSLAELVAVVLNVGTKTEDVLSMSKRLVKEYGVSALSSQMVKHVKLLPVVKLEDGFIKRMT
jgi:hypothetical protein